MEIHYIATVKVAKFIPNRKKGAARHIASPDLIQATLAEHETYSFQIDNSLAGNMSNDELLDAALENLELTLPKLSGEEYYLLTDVRVIEPHTNVEQLEQRIYYDIRPSGIRQRTSREDI